MPERQLGNQKGQYSCESCERSFQTQSELREHEQSQHNIGQGSNHVGQKIGSAGQSRT